MLITNATVVTWENPNSILHDYAIHISEGKISDIGPAQALKLKYPVDKILDANGKMVFPGNICAHTHFYGTFSRGMAIPGSAPSNFAQILEKLWWPLDKSLTCDDIKYSALICEIDAIKHGTTTLIDHHASPNLIEGSLDIIADTIEQSGLRAGLCYEVTDRDGDEKTIQGIQENVRFIRDVKKRPATLSAMFGLHAPLTLSNQTLDTCRNAAPDETGFNIHVSESNDDNNIIRSSQNLKPIEWLNKHGILGRNTMAAHCVHIDESEMETLSSSQTWVSHQPRSNMNNAVGVAPVEKMISKGIKVCLGNDGFSNSMWDEWKSAYFLHKLNTHDPRSMNGYTVIEMGVQNNSRFASSLFNTEIGVIKIGAAADLIIVDYSPPTPMTAGNLPWHILFGFRESMVLSTIVNGQILMQDRVLLTLDEIEISARACELSQTVWDRYNKSFK